MRLPLAVAASLALTAGAALAQPAPPPGSPGGPPAGEARPAPPGPPGGPMMGGPMMGGPMMSGPMMGHGGPGRGWHPGPPPPRGASFHFERGDASIGIRCPVNETVRACVDASVVLLDRLVPAGQR